MVGSINLKLDELNSTYQNNIMLPVTKDPETAEFALSNSCGPTLSQIRVLEICSGLKDGSFICASAGDDSKSDRCISIWDIRTGTLVKRIDNGSNKAIIILYFHPIYTNLLFSVDMDFDVKLWDWETGEIQKHWKKHHSRIIHKIELLPGTGETMVSCSGDQSLKLWDLENDKVPQRSIHANEPITSFVFCGSPSDPTQQKIVISLSYSIRIYKLRTLGMIHNIPLKELKEK
jgi:WD40 repeat protein